MEHLTKIMLDENYIRQIIPQTKTLKEMADLCKCSQDKLRKYMKAHGLYKYYCEQHNIPFHDPGLKAFSKNDNYFNYYDHGNDAIDPRNETDANMDKECIKKLYEAASGRKVNHITCVTQKSSIPTFLKLIKSSKNKITVIGRCMGHFFTIRNVNADGELTGENGELDIRFLHDPQINTGTEFYKNYYENF